MNTDIVRSQALAAISAAEAVIVANKAILAALEPKSRRATPQELELRDVRIRKFSIDFIEKNGRKPLAKEVADGIGCRTKEVHNSKAWRDRKSSFVVRKSATVQRKSAVSVENIGQRDPELQQLIDEQGKDDGSDYVF